MRSHARRRGPIFRAGGACCCRPRRPGTASAMLPLHSLAFAQPFSALLPSLQTRARAEPQVGSKRRHRAGAMCAARRPPRPLPPPAAVKAPAPWFGSLDHRSTIAILPPAGTAWERLQAMRRECRAVGLYRWPPHCNVFYPFLPARFVSRGRDVPQLREMSLAISKLPPFEVRLRNCDVFVHERSVTLILCPETRRLRADRGGNAAGVAEQWSGYRSPQNSITRLYAAVELASPEVAAQMRRCFVPHVSVARFSCKFVAHAWKARLNRDLARQPICFEVHAAHILTRSGSEPFQGTWDIPLRGSRKKCQPMVNFPDENLAPSDLKPYAHPSLREMFPLEYPATDSRRRKWPLVVYGRSLTSYKRRRLPWYR